MSKKKIHNLFSLTVTKISLLASTVCICLVAFAGLCLAGDYVIEPCAPEVAPKTIQAIIGVESRGDPLAIHVNSKARVPFPKPRNREQAIRIANRLIAAGYSVDCGLMQVNSQHLSPGGITTADLFDPCKNVRVGGEILTDDYTTAASIFAPGQLALLAALSAYNTGNFTSGFYNGYVGKYLHGLKSCRFSFAGGLHNSFGVWPQAQSEDTCNPYEANTSVDFYFGGKKPKPKDAKNEKGGGAVVLSRNPSPYAAPTAVDLSFPIKEKNDVSETRK
ncbi:MAG: lytic transglycosylase domain-containing protein [Syntrophobacteraceae bacterium]